MTATTTRSPARPTGKQTVATITRAEVKKLLGQGGIRVWLVVATILAIASGVLAIVISGLSAVRTMGGITVADVVTSGPVAAALVLSLAVTHYVPREVGDGTVMSARCLVPRTKALFASRMIAWCLVAAGLAVVTALLPLPLALLFGDVVGSPPLLVAAVLLTSTVLAALLVGLAHAAATFLRRAAVVVVVMMMLLLVIPLVVTLGGVMASGPVAAVLLWMGRVTLGSLVLTILQVPTQEAQPWGPWSWSLVGFIVWLAATTALAYLAFRRPGYGDR